MEDPQLRVDRHGDNAVGELGEERAEAQQKRLAAGGSFGADDEVALGEEAADAAGVGVAVAGEGDGADGGDELGEAADAVGDAGDLAAEGDGGDDGVEDGAVVADEEDAGLAGGRGRRRGAADDEVDAHEAVGVADDAFGEGDVDVDAEEGEEGAGGEPEEGDGGAEGSRPPSEAAVVEDHWPEEFVAGGLLDAPAEGSRDQVGFLREKSR